ncbi:MAG: rhodanese-like domain-containing protein [Chloroflexi bacterium]|nr:rhodanese-like domain-containing protein [Chloroflexota bacterium]
MNRRLSLLTLLSLFVLLLGACGGTTSPAAPPAETIDLESLPVNIQTDDVAALLENPDVIIIDVREQYEYDEGHISGVELIPLGTIPERMDEIPTDKTVIAVCRSGNRSSQATEFLRQQGFDNVHNMEGGMNAWTADGYQVER